MDPNQNPDQTQTPSVQGLPPGVTLRPIQGTASSPNILGLPPGVTLRPVQAAAPQIAPVPAPTATISAVQQPTSYLGRLAQWTENVSKDLQDGGDRTGIGTVMQKLGAHGLHSGNSEAVGDFMGSLPLGLLKAVKGGTELAPSVVGGPQGKTWQGIKDLVGGGLQAATIPSAFVAPEESVLSKEGLLSDAVSAAQKGAEAVESGARSAVRPATQLSKQILRGEDIAQPETQAALRSVGDSGITHTFDAASGEVRPVMKAATSAPEGTSLREVLSKPISDAQAEKEALYKAYDDAAGVDRKALQDRLFNTQDQMSKLTGTPADMKRMARLKDAETSLKQTIADADSKAKDAGVDIADADAANTKLRALQQVEEKVFHNQSVIQGDISSGQPETVNVDNAIRELQKLKDNEKYGGPRLEQAFGKDNVAQLMTDLRTYQAAGAHALKVQRFAKMVGATLGIGTLGGVGGRLGYKAAQHLTSSSSAE